MDIRRCFNSTNAKTEVEEHAGYFDCVVESFRIGKMPQDLESLKSITRKAIQSVRYLQIMCSSFHCVA